MGKKGPRTTVYVCCALSENKIISKTVEADNSEEAMNTFEIDNGVKAQIIHGPFFQKRAGVLDNTREIKFTGTSKRGIYKDWIVNALLLKDPVNSAYLLFDKRVDGRKMPKPTGTFVIQVDELRNLK